jgi:hypothetical protein
MEKEDILQANSNGRAGQEVAMGAILPVKFAQGDLIEQLFQLKVSALKNDDVPALWRMTEILMELTLAAAQKEDALRWPEGYISDTRLFDVPVDFVHDLPHLLCESYVIYPYMVRPQIWHSA